MNPNETPVPNCGAHTPGPWLCRRGNEIYTIEQTAPDGVFPNIVAYVIFSDGGTREEFEAQLSNACLLAAAPTMLSALRASLNPTGHTDTCLERRAFGETRCSKHCARIRDAITAATGEELPA